MILQGLEGVKDLHEEQRQVLSVAEENNSWVPALLLIKPMEGWNVFGPTGAPTGSIRIREEHVLVYPTTINIHGHQKPVWCHVSRTFIVSEYVKTQLARNPHYPIAQNIADRILYVAPSYESMAVVPRESVDNKTKMTIPKPSVFHLHDEEDDWELSK